MELKTERLAEIIESIISDKDFHEAFDITRENSSGSIWLIGGFLYKNIANALYGSNKSTKDFDFIVEKEKNNLILPEGWKITKNHFDNPKFTNREKQIDFIPLDKIYYIKANNLTPSIDNFLEGGGLNIHCIAYDILKKELLGKAGIKALEERTISAYNLKMLEHARELYGKTPNEQIKKKAEELGFGFQLV